MGRYDEISAYNFNTGQSNGGVIGHFTQVVWKTSVKVGCGVKLDCSNMFGGMQNSAVVCRYSPPGNFIGQYTQNVGNTKSAGCSSDSLVAKKTLAAAQHAMLP